MSIIYPNGAGDTLGDTLVTCKPLYTSGSIWYVNSVGGVDAASPAGQNREKPLATLQQAITNSADGDIIELMSGHSELVTAGWSVVKQLVIVGAGSSGGKPTVKLGMNAAGLNMLTATVAAVELRNIWFLGNAQTNAQPRIVLNAANFRMLGCYVECGAFDVAAAVTIPAAATSARFVNSTFISTATLTSAQPASAMVNTGNCANLEVDGCVFSAGTVGFSNYRAVDFSASTITQLKMTNISQLLGADIKLNAATTGFVNIQTATGGARLDW